MAEARLSDQILYTDRLYQVPA